MSRLLDFRDEILAAVEGLPAEVIEELERLLDAAEGRGAAIGGRNAERAKQQAEKILQALGEREIRHGTATWLQKKIARHPGIYGLEDAPSLPKVRRTLAEEEARRNSVAPVQGMHLHGPATGYARLTSPST